MARFALSSSVTEVEMLARSDKVRLGLELHDFTDVIVKLLAQVELPCV